MHSLFIVTEKKINIQISKTYLYIYRCLSRNQSDKRKGKHYLINCSDISILTVDKIIYFNAIQKPQIIYYPTSFLKGNYGFFPLKIRFVFFFVCRVATCIRLPYLSILLANYISGFRCIFFLSLNLRKLQFFYC